jgi:hypothetical protein
MNRAKITALIGCLVIGLAGNAHALDVQGTGWAKGKGAAKGTGTASGTGVVVYRDANGNIRHKKGTGTVTGKGIAIGKGGVAGKGRAAGRGKAGRL